MTATTGPAAPAAEVRRGARNGAVGLIGAAVNGACGFVLTAVLVRAFGADGSGALFAAIGLVSILGPLCCLGADTGLLWALPRRTPGPGGDAARLLPLAVLPTVVPATVVGAGGALLTPLFLADPNKTLIQYAFLGVPLFTAATVLLAAVRAVRPVGAYVLVQLIAVPVLRPLLVGAAALAGGSLLLGFGGWLLPMAASVLAAFLLVAGPLGLYRGAALRPTADDRRWFWGFALPRAASAAIDASSMWVGVLLTGALATQAEAGVFGAVGRYVLAGLLIMQGLRVAVAPQLSGLLGAGRISAAVAVYRRITLFIVLLSWPAYLMLGVFAPGFLTLFGSEFAAGALPMAVLSAAMLVNVGVGLVQTLLLMSGHSRRHLYACLTGLLLNVLCCVLLIPSHGALGAALAWSAGIVAENVLAFVFARRALAQPLFSPRLLAAGGGALALAGAFALIGVTVAGRGVAGLAVAAGLLAVAAASSLLSGRVRAQIMSLKEARG